MEYKLIQVLQQSAVDDVVKLSTDNQGKEYIIYSFLDFLQIVRMCQHAFDGVMVYIYQ